MRSNDRLCLCTIMPLLVLMVGAVQALAAAPGQGDCTGPDADRTIASCTSLLQQSGQLSPRVKVAALNHRGVAYVRNRDYDRAIADYDAALQIAPNHASTYNFRGIAYRLKGDHDRAIADHDAAIRLDSRNAQFFNNRGVAYRWKSDYDRAIADYSQAIRLHPNYGLAYGNRAFA
jgi:tetratricopeptide (TPR) repeat protein